VSAPPPNVNDEILRWNFYLLDIFRMTTSGPTQMSRNAAMAYGAAYDAVNSITPFARPYLGPMPVPADCAANRQQCLNAAVNYAAAGVLGAEFPTAAGFVDAARRTEDQRIGQGPAANAGRTVGQQAAERMVRARSNDGSTDNRPYVPDNVPGGWRPTSGGGCSIATAVSPNWGMIRPFTMSAGSPFRPQRPGGFQSYAALLASTLYADNLAEVRSLGRFNSTTRTAEQTRIAFFWANDVAGTYHPQGQNLDHTRIVAQQRGLTLAQNTRLFALVAFALADAAITAWDSKFLTQVDLWRPETAIRLAATDNNPATTPDAGWAPLSVLPNGERFNPCFPAYTSGHATFAGAWSTAMRSFFGTDNVTFTATTDDPNAAGVTRTFTSFSAAAREDAQSRIYLGVHFPFDAEFGLSSGANVAQFVAQNYLQPS
jgi:membrane-associated phospholipid phosphatase